MTATFDFVMPFGNYVRKRREEPRTIRRRIASLQLAARRHSAMLASIGFGLFYFRVLDGLLRSVVRVPEV